MKWTSLNGRFPEAVNPPYLVNRGQSGPGRESLGGLLPVPMTVAECRRERDVVEAVAAALGFPAGAVRGWDALHDVVGDWAEESRPAMAVHVEDASELAARNTWLFTRSVWQLMLTTQSVEVRGRGDAQLEFLFWGDWAQGGGSGPST